MEELSLEYIISVQLGAYTEYMYHVPKRMNFFKHMVAVQQYYDTI